MKKFHFFLLPVLTILLGFFFLKEYLSAYPSYLWLIKDSSTDFFKNFQETALPFVLTFLFFALVGSLFFLQKIKKVFWGFVSLPAGVAFFLLLYALFSPESQNLFGPHAPFVLFFQSYAYLFLLTIAIIFTLILLKNTGEYLPNKDTQSNDFFAIANALIRGALCFILIGWVFGKMGLFVWPVVLTLIFVLTFIAWEKISENLQALWRLEFQPKSVADIIFYGLISSIFALNIAQAFYPFSTGWDSANHYLVTIKTLIESGHLISGIFPPFIEILAAFFGIFTGLAGVQFFLISLSSLLIWVIYQAWKQFFPEHEKEGKLLALSFFLLPAIQFQLSQDIKFDAILLSIFIIMIVQLWAQNIKAACLLMGMLVWAKLTFIWAIPGFLISLICLRKGNIRKLLSDGIVLATPILFVVISHWISWGFSEKNLHLQNPLTFAYQSIKGPEKAPVLNFSWEKFTPRSRISSHESIDLPEQESSEVSTENTVEKKNFSSDATPTGFTEEVARYSNFETNFFARIYATFTSPSIDDKAKQYIDLGFWWLVMLLVIPVFWLQKIPKKFWAVLPIAISFFIGWIWIGHGIGWYGLPFVFILYFLFFVALKNFFATGQKPLFINKIFSQILLIIFTVTIFLHVLGRLAHTPYSHFYNSFAWASFPNEITAHRTSQYFFQSEIDAAEFINTEKSGHVLQIGTLIKFWLEDAEERIISDPQLDIFQKFATKGPDGILHQLKQNDIKFIVIDRGTTTIEKDPQGTLHQKFAVLESFLKEAEAKAKIQPLVMGQRIILVKVK